MCFFKKKDTKNTVRKDIVVDKEVIANNVKTFDALIVMAKGNEDVAAKLTRLQDKVKYLNPSVNDKVIKLDEKIGDSLGDLKILLNKSSDKTEKVEKLISDIEVAIVERDTANI